MQTLSRYFVAFLLLLVSSFLEEKEPEEATQQASFDNRDLMIEISTPSEADKDIFYPCS